jgi:hypothetical protein
MPRTTRSTNRRKSREDRFTSVELAARACRAGGNVDNGAGAQAVVEVPRA